MTSHSFVIMSHFCENLVYRSDRLYSSYLKDNCIQEVLVISVLNPTRFLHDTFLSQKRVSLRYKSCEMKIVLTRTMFKSE